VLVLRSSDSKIAAFRNNCRKRPHALLTARQGHLSATIACDLHELVYGLDGKFQSGGTPGDLTPLELSVPGKFILVRALPAKSADPGGGQPLTSLLATSLIEIAGSPAGDWASLPDLVPAGSADIAVAADWKLIVEQWLEALPRPTGVRRTFLPPNQLLEVSSTDALVLQVIPESPGHCRIRRLDYAARAAGSRRPPRGARGARGAKIHAGSRNPAWLQQDIEVAESMQTGLAAGIDAVDEVGPVSMELAEFRRTITVLLPMARGGR
jgi:phenylpropionate dioxygenase-like ring-hydroxylating dioxygenase large terminal subunit